MAAAGFWSYVQRDDEGDNGRILALAEDLGNQYRIQTGEELELFVDRDSIQWGEAWEQRINDAIAGTTFFIPVITPSYFLSNSCRQELLKFVREAERLGLQQLLMSVYWVFVPALETNPEESADEAIRHVAKYQWQDLRSERFEERDSSAYRRAVSGLAAEISRRATGVEEVEDVPHKAQLVVEAGDDHDDDELGIVERIARGEDALVRITEILGEIGVGIREVGERTAVMGSEVDAATSRGQGIKAVLASTNRLANELEGPASVIENRGHEYAKALSELDPGMHAWLDLIEEQDRPGAQQQEFLQEVIGMVAASSEAVEALEELTQGAKTMSTLSRSLRAPVRKMRNGLQGVLDGKAIIAEWGKRAKEIQKETAEGAGEDDEVVHS
jgi:TIR domain-containing protein